MASAPPTWSQEKSFLGLAVTDLLQMAMPKKLSLTHIVAFVNTLARLHNHCISEAYHREDLDTLPLDLQYMMEDDCGYIKMTTGTNYNVPVPLELINSGDQSTGLDWVELQNH